MTALTPTLHAIQRLLPTAIAVRTDSPVPGAPDQNCYFIAERAGTSPMRVAIKPAAAPWPDHEAQSSLCHRLQMQPAAAQELVPHLHTLWNTNPIGAWCLQPERMPDRVLQALHPEAAPASAVIAPMLDALRTRLPDLASIEVVYLRNDSSRGQPIQRQWVSFVAPGRQERAAMSWAMAALHTRDWLIGADHDHLQRNRDRVQAWAHQIGTTPDALAEVLLVLQPLIVVLQTTRIDLTPLAA